MRHSASPIMAPATIPAPKQGGCLDPRGGVSSADGPSAGSDDRGALVSVGVYVFATAKVCDALGVVAWDVAVGGQGVRVRVGDGVGVGVWVAVAVAVGDGVDVGVLVAVAVAVAVSAVVAVALAVGDGVPVAMGVGVPAAVAVGCGVAIGTVTCAGRLPPL